MSAARDKKVMVYLEKKEMQLFICESYATLRTTQYSQSQLIKYRFFWNMTLFSTYKKIKVQRKGFELRREGNTNLLVNKLRLIV
jgi:hypothetical protein